MSVSSPEAAVLAATLTDLLGVGGLGAFFGGRPRFLLTGGSSGAGTGMAAGAWSSSMLSGSSSSCSRDSSSPSPSPSPSSSSSSSAWSSSEYQRETTKIHEINEWELTRISCSYLHTRQNQILTAVILISPAPHLPLSSSSSFLWGWSSILCVFHFTSAVLSMASHSVLQEKLVSL